MVTTLVGWVPAEARADNSPASETVSVVAAAGRQITASTRTLHPGTTTFRVTTPDSTARWVSLVRLHPGTSLQKFLDDMTTVLTTRGEERTRAVAEWNREADMLGGVSVFNRRSQSFTQFLKPGTYYLVDLRTLGGPDRSGASQEIAVRGDWDVTVPRSDQTITYYTGPDGGTRISAPSRLAARTRLLVNNMTGKHEEAILNRIRPDTSPEELAKAIRDEEYLPFVGEPEGVVPVAGGRRVVAGLDLEPGRYVLISWVNDPALTHRIIEVG
ncbi:hypothetical protein GCM10012275_31050 [Longimycelium tulufanense]|uniref:Uncharacterized protein n=1 Tax=Longimycelium tulufanense TaxID=907463 RepID=A0A8J3CC77_9PSEU|nr:hypothetical protein [Longimycelium tulufanense]GGM57646.1 hypothetical protein GCM10012275_31050 [Longimycelium tulufanense]